MLTKEESLRRNLTRCVKNIVQTSKFQVLALIAALTRNGTTPEQAVFGRSLRRTDLCNRDDDEIPLAALGANGEAWKAVQIRAAAKMHLTSRDASDKIRRAMMRRALKAIGGLAPDT